MSKAKKSIKKFMEENNTIIFSKRFAEGENVSVKFANGNDTVPSRKLPTKKDPDKYVVLYPFTTDKGETVEAPLNSTMLSVIDSELCEDDYMLKGIKSGEYTNPDFRLVTE